MQFTVPRVSAELLAVGSLVANLERLKWGVGWDVLLHCSTLSKWLSRGLQAQHCYDVYSCPLEGPLCLSSALTACKVHSLRK